MRVALATWNGRISPVFDVARQVLLVDIEKGRETARSRDALPGTDPHAQAERLKGLGVEVLICGAVSRPMADLLAGLNVRVLPFTAGDEEDVLSAWRGGALPAPTWSMPGCCGRMRRSGGGRGRGGCRGSRSRGKPEETRR